MTERLSERGHRRKVLAVALSTLCHVVILVAFLATATVTVDQSPDEAVNVELISLPHPPAPPTPQPKTPKKAPTRANSARPVKALPKITQLAATPEPSETPPVSELTAAQISGAASADSGPSGQACDMARWLQSALRKDRLVQAAVATFGPKTVRVWDGDWVKSGSEDGKGLAAVREAIMWEVAFAPSSCRAEPVRGLVLLAMGPTRNATRLALGHGIWRWGDLVSTR